MALLAAAFASLIFGVADFAGGIATRSVSVRVVVLFSQLFGLFAITGAALLVASDGVDLADLLYGGAAGLMGMVALLLLYRGLAEGRMSVVSPLAAIAGIGLPVAFGVLIGERPSTLAAVGIAVSIPAIGLISASTQADQGNTTLWRGGLVHGLAAGLGFGGFFILISRTAETSGMWPLVSARMTTVATLAIVMMVGRAIHLPPRAQAPMIVVAGISDALANLFFLVAVRGSLLILASVIVSLYPISTLILARVVLGERTSTMQRLGLALGALAVAAIAAG